MAGYTCVLWKLLGEGCGLRSNWRAKRVLAEKVEVKLRIAAHGHMWYIYISFPAIQSYIGDYTKYFTDMT